MFTINIAGDASSALSHFALLGLAAVAEEMGDNSVRLLWSLDSEPKAQLRSIYDPLLIAQRIRELATRWSEDSSWVKARKNYAGKQFAPFSPRIKAIDAEKSPYDWEEHHHIRTSHVDQLLADKRWLDLSFISALGEPSYWHNEKKAPRPDHGASRWEMKTRNRGEEFVQHRLSLMVDELSSWTNEDILAGIQGKQVHDPLGKNSPDSRTSTGLTPPGPTDVALAFVGLLGIASFQLAPQVKEKSVTPGAFPPQALHPVLMVLPMSSTPISLGRARSVLRSEAIACIGGELVRTGDIGTTAVVSASKWLLEHGINAVALFDIKKAGSSSAPERQVQPGSVLPLG